VFMLMDYVSAIAICNIITINKYLHIISGLTVPCVYPYIYTSTQSNK